MPFGNAAGGVISAKTALPMYASPTPQFETSITTGPDQTLISTLQAGAQGENIAGQIARQRLSSDGNRAHSQVHREQSYARLDLGLAAGQQLIFTGNLIRQPDTADPLGLTCAQFDADARQAPTQALAFNIRKS